MTIDSLLFAFKKFKEESDSDDSEFSTLLSRSSVDSTACPGTLSGTQIHLSSSALCSRVLQRKLTVVVSSLPVCDCNRNMTCVNREPECRRVQPGYYFLWCVCGCAIKGKFAILAHFFR